VILEAQMAADPSFPLRLHVESAQFLQQEHWQRDCRVVVICPNRELNCGVAETYQRFTQVRLERCGAVAAQRLLIPSAPPTPSPASSCTRNEDTASQSLRSLSLWVKPSQRITAASTSHPSGCRELADQLSHVVAEVIPIGAKLLKQWCTRRHQAMLFGQPAPAQPPCQACSTPGDALRPVRSSLLPGVTDGTAFAGADARIERDVRTAAILLADRVVGDAQPAPIVGLLQQAAAREFVRRGIGGTQADFGCDHLGDPDRGEQVVQQMHVLNSCQTNQGPCIGDDPSQRRA
jgi:hypothetical protein